MLRQVLGGGMELKVALCLYSLEQGWGGFSSLFPTGSMCILSWVACLIIDFMIKWLSLTVKVIWYFCDCLNSAVANSLSPAVALKAGVPFEMPEDKSCSAIPLHREQQSHGNCGALRHRGSSHLSQTFPRGRMWKTERNVSVLMHSALPGYASRLPGLFPWAVLKALTD